VDFIVIGVRGFEEGEEVAKKALINLWWPNGELNPGLRIESPLN